MIYLHRFQIVEGIINGVDSFFVIDKALDDVLVAWSQDYDELVTYIEIRESIENKAV